MVYEFLRADPMIWTSVNFERFMTHSAWGSSRRSLVFHGPLSGGQVSVASVLSKVEVTAANGNQEAQAFGYDFVNCFQEAGCASDLILPIPGLTADVTGIHIAVRDVNAIPPGAVELAKLLSALHLQFRISSMNPEFFPDSPFVLVIGAKQP